MKPNSKQLSERQIAAEFGLSQLSLQYHLEHHFFIKDKKGAIRLMAPLRRSQRMFLSLIEHIQKEWVDANYLVRVAVLKTRKTGLSTVEACRHLIEVKEYGYDAAIIAHDLPTASYIFGILKRAYDYYDLPKPKLARGNKRELKFANHEGYIEVFTANQVEALRGRTPQIVHGSEVAFWEKGSEAAIALFQAVARELNTSVVLETTAHGEDLLFHPLWQNASEGVQLRFEEDEAKPFGFHIDLQVLDEDKWNGYFPLFISALDDEEDCREPLVEGEAERLKQTLDEYELMLRERFNAPLEFIKWRRRTLRFQCQGDVRILNAEYPVTPEEAFVVSGDPRFDTVKLDSMPTEHGVPGYFVRSDKWDRAVSFKEDRFEKGLMFRRVEKTHRYVIAVDTAEGILPDGAKDPDESVCVVFDIDNGPSMEEVYTYAGQLSEEVMTKPVAMIAEYYNMAYVVPEHTGGHGEHLIEQLSKIYPVDRIYKRHDSSGSKLGLRIGLQRNDLIADMADAIIEGEVKLHNKKGVRQCKNFAWNRRGRVEATAGHHDDYVFAYIGAIQGYKHYPRGLRPSDGSLLGAQQDLDFNQRWPMDEHLLEQNLPDSDGGY